ISLLTAFSLYQKLTPADQEKITEYEDFAPTIQTCISTYPVVVGAYLTKIPNCVDAFKQRNEIEKAIETQASICCIYDNMPTAGRTVVATARRKLKKLRAEYFTFASTASFFPQAAAKRDDSLVSTSQLGCS
ncbi:MAG: hypothetical protein HOF98_12005, partial [Gammaproteobacteria bacterium]|nr:hypothetical protein [Gammaproteobacteria bacterium]